MGLGSFYTDLMRGLGASTRVFGIMDEPVDSPKGALTVPSITPQSIASPVSAELVPNTATTGLRPELHGTISFRSISFTYPTRDTPIFTDLSFTISSGTVVGIMGESGGGKSTVSSLLLRLYDPSSGSIEIDGFDLRTLDPTWFRERVVGIVAQEPTLFVGSVMENIRYGRLDATDEEVYEAAREANCYEFVMGFPEGFETKLGERGVNLSGGLDSELHVGEVDRATDRFVAFRTGGQRQRIAIARALLKNPRILVLDEATSNLDSVSEYLVQQALERLMKGRTVLIVAHRLSTIRSADQLLVIQKGQVVERGTWEELMRHDETSAFRMLVKRQHGGLVEPGN